MATAPISVALGAIGTVSNISAQNRQAAAQRQSVEAQRLAAQQSYELQKQRFDYSRVTANNAFAREVAVTNELKNNAFRNLEVQSLQQQIGQAAQGLQQTQQLAQIDQQVSQLLAGAANTRTQAGLQNLQQLSALALSLTGNEQEARNFTQRLILTNQDPALAQQVIRESLLQQISNFQSSLESTNTRSRVAGAQASALEGSADLQRQYRDVASQFFNAQNTAQNQFNQFVANRMPGLLDIQHQRNIAALEAARYSNQAELNIAESASALNLQNQQRQLNAQSSAIGSSNLNTFTGILGFASQAVPSLLASLQPAQPQQSQFSFGSGFNSFTPTTRQFRGINDITFQGSPFGPVRSDFTGSTIYG